MKETEPEQVEPTLHDKCRMCGCDIHPVIYLEAYCGWKCEAEFKTMYCTTLEDDQFPELGTVTIASESLEGLRNAWVYVSRIPFDESIVQEVEVKLKK